MADRLSLTTFAADGLIRASDINSNFTKINEKYDDLLGKGGVSESSNSLSGNLDFNTFRGINVSNPVNVKDAVNKQYVDSLVFTEDPLTIDSRIKVSSYSTLTEAVTAIGSSVVDLYIDISIPSDSAVVPSNIRLIFQFDGKLTWTTTPPEINGFIEAGPYQIFDGPGVVDLTSAVFDYAYPQWWGAVADGSDSTTELQAALGSGAKSVRFLVGSYLISAPLDVPSGMTVSGEGPNSVISMSGSADPKIFSLTGKSNILISSLRMVPQSTGTTRAAVFLDLCQRVTIRDCFVYGQTDAIGVYLVDSDDCVVDNLYFDGGTGRAGYAAYLLGCKGCKVSNSTAYRPDFGFVIVGADINPATTRTTEESFGNIIDSCSVREHGGHAYDINAATGNVISNSTAEDYGGSSTNVAFQVKHPSGDNARQNVIIGCTARNVPSGFGAQEGSNAVFVGCTATNVSKYGFLLNSSSRMQFIGCNAREFGEYGIWMSSSSQKNIFNGIVLETSTPSAIGIGLVSSGVSNNIFDNIQMVGTLSYSIDIASGANNNRFGMNVDANAQAIRDLSATSQWPIIVTTPEISVAATGNVNGPYVHRGMIVAVARVSITSTISGTPQVQCGRVNENTEIATSQAVTGVAGVTVALTQANQLLGTAAIVQGRVQVAGSGGTVFFQYEGLPRL